MRNKIINTLINAVIFMLFASMVAMSVLTFVYSSSDGVLEVGDEWEDLSPIYRPAAGYSDALDTDRLLPMAVGIKTDDVKLCTYSGDSVSSFYSLVAPVISRIASSGAAVTPANEGDIEACLSGEYVFAQYLSPVPLSVILAFAGTDNSEEFVGRTDGGVTDIFLCGENNTTVIIRTDIGVFRMESGSEPFDITPFEDYARANKSVMCGYEFSFEAGYDRGGLLLTAENMSFKDCTVSVTNAYTTMNSERMSVLFDLFSFNPDKLNYNKPDADSITFVETHGALSIDKKITYTAISGGGIPVARLTEDAKTGILRYIKAADRIVHATESELFSDGGNAEIKLYSVYADGGEIAVKYIYTVGNLPVTVDGGYVTCEFRFTEDKLVSATVSVADARYGNGTTSMFTGLWMLTIHSSRLDDGDITQIIPAYTTDGDGVFQAEWLIFTEGGVSDAMD